MFGQAWVLDTIPLHREPDATVACGTGTVRVWARVELSPVVNSTVAASDDFTAVEVHRLVGGALAAGSHEQFTHANARTDSSMRAHCFPSRHNAACWGLFAELELCGPLCPLRISRSKLSSCTGALLVSFWMARCRRLRQAKPPPQRSGTLRGILRQGAQQAAVDGVQFDHTGSASLLLT